MPDPRPAMSQRNLLLLIMGGLVAWSLYVAIGAYMYNYNPWRVVVILGCTAVFLGFWLLALWNRKRRQKRS
jgi:ABC-type transport system involved in Fe-S cluster assembly fused permease/ATPase subunit